MLALSIALLSVLAFSPVSSQQADHSKSLATPTTVAEAEAEGAGFPREAPPASLPAAFVAQGIDERKCVAFPAGAALSHISSIENSRRSGDFVVGGMIIEGLQAGIAAKVFWVPRHDPESRKATLVVRSVRPDDSAMTSRFDSEKYARSVKWDPVTASLVNLEHGFYPSGFSLPSSGRWLFIATSANDWGCFIITVRS